MTTSRGTALLMTSHRGQTSRAEAREQEHAGRRPRRGPSEVADRLGADLIDAEWLEQRGHPLARLVARHRGVAAGQLVEVAVRHRRYAHVCAWADRLGLPLALFFKLVRARVDLTLVSVDLLAPKKAVFLSRLRVHTHLRGIQSPSTVQIATAVTELGVPPETFRFAPQPVDTAFWRSTSPPSGRRICAVGWEARDYPTLLRAVRGLDADVHVAVGTVVFSRSEQAGEDGAADSAPPPLEALRGTAGYDSYREAMSSVTAEDVGAVVWHRQLDHVRLRELYESSLLVVVPLLDVPFDAGATVLQEAAAMGRPVVVTRTRGQVDLVVEGETGHYVEPGNVDGLRAALARLLDDPEECRRMGAAARRRAEHFDFDGFVQSTADFVLGAAADD